MSQPTEKSFFEKVADIEELTPITVGAEMSQPTAEQTATNEELARALRKGDGAPEGTREALLRSARMLDTYSVDLYPANEKGQVHFARAIMESAADEIRAFFNAEISAEQAAYSKAAKVARDHGKQRIEECDYDGMVIASDIASAIEALATPQAQSE